VDLLIPADPTEVSNIESPKPAQNTPGPSKTKKTKQTNKDEDVQYVDNRSVRNASITLEKGGNGKDLEGVEQRPGDEVEIIKKRKGSPPESSSQKKSKAPMTKLKTTLTPDEFSFLIAAMNKSIEEITEKKEAKKETMYNRIEIKLQGLQQALPSSCTVSSVPLSEGTKEEGNEPVQIHQIVDMVEVHLQKAQEETAQATQALRKNRRKSLSNIDLHNKRRTLSKRSLKKKSEDPKRERDVSRKADWD
jgi:hypothetical protein